MHTGTLRRWSLLLTFWLALHGAALKAQTFTAPLQASTTGTDPVDFEFRADGTMIAKGNFGVGSLLTADQGDGARLLWFPSLGAFRAGVVSTGLSVGSGPWDAPQLGTYSAAFGYNTIASGTYTAAFGSNTTASGLYAVAFGLSSQATGVGATATGWHDYAIGDYSVCMGGGNSATGGASVAMGSINSASGANSFVVGVGNAATGGGAVAFGDYNTASGYFSTVSGYHNTAIGSIGTAIGAYLTVSAAYCVAFGKYNIGGGTDWEWVATDPLFELGNGTSTTPSDAFVVYKNGDVTAQGVITAAPGGDIPMYSGN